MISGVQDVQSFHEQEILLLTEEGKLQIKGEGLHVKRLNLEKGEADIEGKINSLIYLSRNTPKKEKKLPTLLMPSTMSTIRLTKTENLIPIQVKTSNWVITARKTIFQITNCRKTTAPKKTGRKTFLSQTTYLSTKR